MITMLDFIKDIFFAFKQNSIERIRNPFIGAFVFSWLGFNWQALSIVLFSKKDIIDRIKYINENYDIGSFLLGPICTTILICFVLPQVNKFFTKIQKKPISETTDIIMQSKIDFAEMQLKIADFDAKKKLAEKREARNIEDGIDAIHRELLETKEKNEVLYSEIVNLNQALDKEKSESISLRAIVNSANENAGAQKNIIIKYDEIIDGLRREIKEKSNSATKLEGEISAYEKFTRDAKSDIKNKEASINYLYSRQTDIIKKYPELFQGDETGIIMEKLGNEDHLKALNNKLASGEPPQL